MNARLRSCACWFQIDYNYFLATQAYQNHRIIATNNVIQRMLHVRFMQLTIVRSGSEQAYKYIACRVWCA